MNMYFGIGIAICTLICMWFFMEGSARQRANLPSGKQLLLVLIFAGIALALAYIGTKLDAGEPLFPF